MRNIGIRIPVHPARLHRTRDLRTCNPHRRHTRPPRPGQAHSPLPIGKDRSSGRVRSLGDHTRPRVSLRAPSREGRHPDRVTSVQMSTVTRIRRIPPARAPEDARGGACAPHAKRAAGTDPPVGPRECHENEKAPPLQPIHIPRTRTPRRMRPCPCSIATH